MGKFLNFFITQVPQLQNKDRVVNMSLYQFPKGCCPDYIKQCVGGLRPVQGSP